MPENIASTVISVTGVRTDADVKKCLQALFDAFTEIGIGQATFEVTAHGTALYVKHIESVSPDIARLDAALRSAGDYAVA